MIVQYSLAVLGSIGFDARVEDLDAVGFFALFKTRQVSREVYIIIRAVWHRYHIVRVMGSEEITAHIDDIDFQFGIGVFGPH